MQTTIRSIAFLASSLAVIGHAQVSPGIRVNQLGFYGAAPKTAAVVGAASDDFFILSPNLADTAFRGKLKAAALWEPSQESARLADFSTVVAPGQYVLSVPGLGVSAPFPIDNRAHFDLIRGSLRAYYYNRSGINLEAAHAGKWARPLGHPDKRVAVHSSAATTERPAETLIASPRGWYDAGDYNKYVVNSGISTYTLLALYSHFPAFFDTLNLGIPESGDRIPDILDEVLWNLRWMLSMQDPSDGGAYHKLTTANFSGSVMPAADVAKRYVVKKSVTATLDLAAVAAYAARVFKPMEDRLPGFSDSCLAVARKAWDWARANPTAYYRQNEMNQTHQPAIVTGEYGDGNALDELQWAGVELYLTTRIDSFYTAAYPTSLPTRISNPSWGGVGALAFYSMAEAVGPQGGAPEGLAKLDPVTIRLRLREAATALTTVVGASAFQVPMVSQNFNWGSNSNAGNMGMLLIQAWRATGEASFLKTAVDALDYLLGRNGPSLSFVTGFGVRSPMFPHHRPSEADGIAEPVPGFLVGGPNTTAKQSDGCVYPSTLPALSYSDTQCSYASNEVTINWNAPLAYLSGALHILYSGNGGTSIREGVRPGSGKSTTRRARLTWGSEGPQLVLPKGVKASIEFFDGQGRTWSAARLRDSARVGEKLPGLLFYRLRLNAGAGRKDVLHSGSWATLTHLSIPL